MQLEARLQGEQLGALQQRHQFVQDEVAAKDERLRAAASEAAETRAAQRKQQARERVLTEAAPAPPVPSTPDA